MGGGPIKRRRTGSAPGPESIRLRGVRVHNLRGVDVEIPRNRMTVVTGVSGSGKSSLAFDTLYAEGRRRYVECLSTYQRQFLEATARPDLDAVSGLPPAVAVERAVPAAQARSTVGTTTEVHDYLRLLFARLGRTCCVDCDRPVREEPAGLVAGELVATGGRGMVLFETDPVSSDAAWTALLDELRRDGFVRVVQQDRPRPLEEADRRLGPLEVVVDRLQFEPRFRTRIAESVETAYRFGHRRCLVRTADDRQLRFSQRLHCPDCDREYRPPEPRLFSPNSPLGACPDCQGFGRRVGPDLDRIVPDRGKTLAEGPVDPWNKPSYRGAYDDLKRAGKAVGLRWDRPYESLPAEHRELIERGGHGFYGIRGFFEWLEGRTYRVHVRVFLSRYRAYRVCTSCQGSKLRPEALAVRVGGKQIAECATRPVAELLAWLRALPWTDRDREIAAAILSELIGRLEFLDHVGLGYLTLDRSSRTLSGGEAQRIQLARALGSALVDTLYVLDEPSVGLHPLDVDRLIEVLHRLRDLGNTVVVVEHDPRVMSRADWIVDLGPGAGADGGRLLYQGETRGLARVENSATARHLQRRAAGSRSRPAEPAGEQGWIELSGASIHNLRRVDARFPRRALTVVTGVSGSGKSSLIHDTLHGALTERLGGKRIETGPFRELTGVDGLAGVELVDQSPLGKSPRSNPVTYVKAFDGIRRCLAATGEARRRGLKPGFFSFNVPGGRCEACEGAGSVRVEMHFLPDLSVPCESCGGTRFGSRALEVLYRGRNVAQILEMTVHEAAERFADVREVARRLAVLDEVGLGYLRLGQPAPTLSGGEAQRLKLASHLGKRGEGPRVFLLDEPTTGLHPSDVEVLIRLLRRLIDSGHTVIVVEHHLALLEAADWILDLGPGPGEAGGQLVAQGSPAEIARSAGATGQYLRRALGGNEGRRPGRG